ncbi:hypothetical protein VP01_8418g1 [Puccinia sorghi]|uniref:Uncharacterized protein n=1 Tax=Puccinia sorghi TaxID=27349 RepID=A0A0L6U9D4_9BASI|nr:hypothetical protein VP01_8418g1 [Puccinia sorghi]
MVMSVLQNDLCPLLELNFGFSPNRTTIYSILNPPGLWHNSVIAKPLYSQHHNKTPKEHILTLVKRGYRLPESPPSYSSTSVAISNFTPPFLFLLVAS